MVLKQEVQHCPLSQRPEITCLLCNEAEKGLVKRLYQGRGEIVALPVLWARTAVRKDCGNILCCGVWTYLLCNEAETDLVNQVKRLHQ